MRAFTTTTLSFVLLFLNGTLTVLAFSGVLWSISPLLFVVAVGYAAVGSLLTVVLGRPLVWLNYDQSDQEANFRADWSTCARTPSRWRCFAARSGSAERCSAARRAGART